MGEVASLDGRANRHNRTFLNRSALVITETEDSDIATPAIIGLSKRPKNG